MIQIRGIKSKRMWAVFAPDGEIQVRTISKTKKDAQSLTPGRGGSTWEDYAKAGFVANKILVDIKLIPTK